MIPLMFSVMIVHLRNKTKEEIKIEIEENKAYQRKY
jgi:hypothetical protein